MMNGRKSRNTGGAARRRNGSTGGGDQRGGGNTAPERVGERKHMTGVEMERLLTATKGGRNKARDRYLLLLMFRHGLRVSEACRLKLD